MGLLKNVRWNCILSFFLAILMIGSLVACGKTVEPTGSEAMGQIEESQGKSDSQPSETVVSIEVSDKTPYEMHGKLSVSGTQIVDKDGKVFQLQGVSTHGIAWFPDYVNQDAFMTLRDEWNVNCVRLAMYSDENNGYCSGGDQEKLKGLVMSGVEYATNLGMYVIIDWHVLGEHDPNVHRDEAMAFFQEMSECYKDYDNVIYEICNEPNSGTDWTSVKNYAEAVIPLIRANDEDALIIVGTPTWCQDVDVAAKDPIQGYDNLLYSIHFYADTHKDSLRKKMKAALKSGLPLFCSEFGICDASGNGAVNTKEADKWMKAMNEAGMSYCIWNLSNKDESSSLIRSNCSKTSGWAYEELSEEGQWYVSTLTNGSAGSQSEPETKGTETKGSKLSADIAEGNSWSDGSFYYYQYEVRVNGGSDGVEDWKATISFNKEVSLDQGWNGNFSVDGKHLIVTPVEYNASVNAGQSISFGFIIKSSKEIKSPSLVLETE